MASNYVLPENYKDMTPAAPLDKKTLNKMVWRSLQLQACFNYERMQSAGWLWGILPGLEKIHTNKDDLAASMTHNMDFLNTHPYLVTFVMGVVLSMEQNKAPIQTIRSVRISIAAPLGGIGDALFWYTFMPIVAGVTAGLAQNGNMLGPILYFVLAFGVQMALRFWLMYWSYGMGTAAITSLTKNAKEFTHAASMMGIFVVGALIYNMGSGVKFDMVFASDATTSLGQEEAIGLSTNVQAQLDAILPGIVPLAMTLMCYYLLAKKGWTPIKTICLLLVIGIVGCIFGIWASGSYTALVPVPWHA